MVAIYFITGIILKITAAFFALLIVISDALLGIVLSGALAVQDMDSVNIGWSVARDTINMFFVIFLLVIAFATILRIEAYQYKQLLPKLIMSILLVNFSRTICSVLIEFSNVLTSAFLNFSQGQETAAGIATLMGISTVWDIDSNVGITDINSLTMVLSMLLITIFMGGLAIAFAGLTGMMITRTIVLLVLVVLSPIAFGMNVLPVTSTYFKKWWDEFIKYLFYGPIAAFCIYLAAIVAADASTHSTAGFAWEGWDSALNTTPATGLPGGHLTQAEFLWEYALVVGLLFLGISMIKEGGGMGAQMTMDFAKKGMTGGAKLVGMGAKAMGHRVSRGLAKAGSGKRAESWRKSGNRFVRGIGKASKYAKFLSPKVTTEAWNARQAELDRKAYGSGVAWAHNKMNKIIPFSNDQTNVERMHEGHAVREEENKLKEMFSGDSHDYLRDQLYKSIKDGDKDRMEACLRLLHGQGNINEVIRDISVDVKKNGLDKSELARLLHSEDYMDEDKIGDRDADAVHDMLSHLFGEDRGLQILTDLGEQGKAVGDWSLAESVRYDLDTGKFRYDKDGRGANAATEFGKQGSDYMNRQKRFTFAKLRYKGEKDEETGKVEGKEKIVDLDEGWEEFLNDQGYTREAAIRVERGLGKNQRETLRDEKVRDKVKEIYENQLAGKKKNKKTGQWEYVADEEKREYIRQRGHLNKIWYEAAAEGKPVDRGDSGSPAAEENRQRRKKSPREAANDRA